MDVANSAGEQRYMAGYNAGRSLSLRTGSSEAGRRWLAESALGSDAAYVAGFEWALWDYEDANGVRWAAGRSGTAG